MQLSSTIVVLFGGKWVANMTSKLKIQMDYPNNDITLQQALDGPGVSEGQEASPAV